MVIAAGAWIESVVQRARRARWANVAAVNLRFLVGFAFVPAALKKVLGQPFTDPSNRGPFHEFLHAFHATGAFYTFVGVLQLAAAVLLCTQRRATIGALIALPIVTAIAAFCWSTRVYPTAAVATLMWLATVALVVWDIHKWRPLLAPDDRPVEAAPPPVPPIDLRLWSRCGAAILALYLGSALWYGGVYRPRGLELSEPAFYVMPVVMLLPILTFAIEQRRRRRG